MSPRRRTPATSTSNSLALGARGPRRCRPLPPLHSARSDVLRASAASPRSEQFPDLNHMRVPAITTGASATIRMCTCDNFAAPNTIHASGRASSEVSCPRTSFTFTRTPAPARLTNETHSGTHRRVSVRRTRPQTSSRLRPPLVLRSQLVLRSVDQQTYVP